jgi:hypothetical protein
LTIQSGFGERVEFHSPIEQRPTMFQPNIRCRNLNFGELKSKQKLTFLCFFVDNEGRAIFSHGYQRRGCRRCFGARDSLASHTGQFIRRERRWSSSVGDTSQSIPSWSTQNKLVSQDFCD